ncbi:6-phosphogluconolactonase [Roseimaritima sediminicola]|uniref:6-phosphogluconolactonase n=1 Tax=Roseimaritima sediminicola TaxID=2662066 RepID=UPI0012985034|nr:6-phosphogluconolactonase [Roseimaritima sediminicola]
MSDRNLQSFPDKAALSRGACQRLVTLAKECIDQNGVFQISLSGGSTPQQLYQLLAETDLPWDRIRWFWGDDRCVPHDHADSNYRMVREALLDRIDADPATVFPVPVDTEDPAAAAAQYEETLRQAFAGQDYPQWDLALQGMGDDAHTASLFPETKAIDEQQRWFVENWVPKFDTHRFTLTANAINSARNIWFLISGDNKRDALQSVWNGPQQPAKYPSQLVRPDHPGLLWWVTEDALP